MTRKWKRWAGAIAILFAAGSIALMIMGLPGWGWCLFAAILTAPNR